MDRPERDREERLQHAAGSRDQSCLHRLDRRQRSCGEHQQSDQRRDPEISSLQTEQHHHARAESP